MNYQKVYHLAALALLVGSLWIGTVAPVAAAAGPTAVQQVQALQCVRNGQLYPLGSVIPAPHFGYLRCVLDIELENGHHTARAIWQLFLT